jgi:ribosomal-protein-alanine N-acetyltransferase
MKLNLPELLETERCYLQRVRYEFAEEIFYAYASKPEATDYVAWRTHTRIEDTRSYLQYAVAAWDRGDDYAYVIRTRHANRLIGSVGCMNEYGKVQFGYIINPNFWNQGFATEAAKKVVQELAGLLNVHRIWTFIDADNVSSARVLQKVGLVEEAKLSNWHRFVNQANQPKDCVLFKLPDHFLSSYLVSK